ncbi:MAG: DUF4440 domain-containing protein [Gemmatimonadales bacterium]
MTRLVVPVFLALAAVAPVAAQRPSVAADSLAIVEAGRVFSRAYERGDVETMARSYTSDGVIFPDRSEPLSGDALRRYWTLPAGRRVLLHRMTPTEIVIEGDLAYDYGVYEYRGENNGQAYQGRGKYVVVWRRDADGNWRMKLDIWNRLPDE